MAYNITSSVTPQSQSSFYGGTSAAAPSGGGSGGGYYSDDKPKKPAPSPLSPSNVKPQRQNVTYVNGRPAFVNGKPVGEFQNRNLAAANNQIYSTTSPDNANLNTTTNIVANNQVSSTGNTTITNDALSDVRLATQALDNIENVQTSDKITAETRTNGSFLSVTENPDGTFHVRTSGIRWGNTVYGSFDLGNLSYNPQTVYDASMPLLNYAANMQSYDTGNQIIQGAMSFGRSMSAISPEFASVYDDAYVSDFLNATDMAYNWNNRNDMENAIAGINTATGVMSKLDLGGASAGAQTVQNGLALYNFGNSFYNLINNWDDLTPQQRIGGMIGTAWAGSMAYTPAADIVSGIGDWATNIGAGAGAEAGAGVGANAGAKAGTVATPQIVKAGSVNASGAASNAAKSGTAGITAENFGVGSTSSTTGGVDSASFFGNNTNTAQNLTTGIGNNTGASTTAEINAENFGLEENNAAAEGSGSLGMYLNAAAFAYYMYDLASDPKSWGPQQGRPRAAVGVGAKYGGAAAAGTAAAMYAYYGTSWTQATGVLAWVPYIAAAVAFCVGYGVGMAKTGHSNEQGKRTLYEKALINASVFDTSRSGSYVMQLADGRFYTLLDGSGKRATDIDGNKKTVYDESKIVDRNYDFVNRRDENGNIRAYLNPYDIDYTCNLDFTSSIMGKGLLSLALGSNYKGSGEMDQMLGYIVNGVTSNTGRDWTRENFNNVVANLKAAYYRTGIGSKKEGVQALVDAYFSGAITESDYRQSLMGLNFVYDDNGFEQASQLMDNMGRNTPSSTKDTQVTNAIDETSQQQIADNGEQLSVTNNTMEDSSTNMVPEENSNGRLTPEELAMVTPGTDTESVTVDTTQGDLTATAVETPTTTTDVPMTPDVMTQYETQQTSTVEAPQEPAPTE